jgi:hypothetical protein
MPPGRLLSVENFQVSGSQLVDVALVKPPATTVHRVGEIRVGVFDGAHEPSADGPDLDQR